MNPYLRSYITTGRPVDRIFASVVAILVICGGFAFLSASFGLLSRSGGPNFSSVVFGQIAYGLLPGLAAIIVFSKLHYTLWRRFALVIFILSVGLNLLLFVPALGLEYNGAVRWLKIFGATIQPSEFLKIAFIIYLSSWLSSAKDRIRDVRFGIIPFFIILAITLALLVAQRDTDNTIILALTALSMYFAIGGRFKDLAIISLIGLVGLSALFYTRPYLRERVKILINPSRDIIDSGYQANQSLVAIGSGQFFGRGFGQSVQKFSRLPEPIGDSIFAVIGEEFGFLGSVFTILIFTSFCLLGLRISIRAPDSFARLTVFGIVIIITAQSFVNIASMLGLFPIAGIPLVFVSQGGSSMLASLASVGIVLNVSRYT